MAIIIYLAILLFSAILHEIAHGLAAEDFGDNTARMMGRITLNPISHIDPYYSILIPFLLVISGSPIIFGAAKPVPVDYYNLRNLRWGVFWVSIAGVLTNFIIALVFALALRFLSFSPVVETIFFMIVQVNILLAAINLIPIPPIDGSKVVASLLGEGAIRKMAELEAKLGLLLLPIMLIFVYLFALPVVNFFTKLFVGNVIGGQLF